MGVLVKFLCFFMQDQLEYLVTQKSSHPWNAFKDSATSVPMDALNQGLQMHDLPSTDDHFFDLRASEGSNKGGMQGIVPVARFDHDLSLHFVSGLPCPPSAFAPMGEVV
ncbi:hypothetical protein GmHk_09G026080 [Glycine max]|nr:hypothetical protein GmHk_09G026080 [Glycine max]